MVRANTPKERAAFGMRRDGDDLLTEHLAILEKLIDDQETKWGSELSAVTVRTIQRVELCIPVLQLGMENAGIQTGAQWNQNAIGEWSDYTRDVAMQLRDVVRRLLEEKRKTD